MASSFFNDNAATDPSGFRELGRSSEQERDYRRRVEDYARESVGTAFDKFENFPKYVSRQNVARHLAIFEIFKLVLPVQGDVIEAGVNWGGGLMWLSLISTVFEPFNLQRRIIGFDTFEGFPSLDARDIEYAETGKEHKLGGYAANSYEDLLLCISNYDLNRPIGHIPKVHLVQGDACKTMPQYLIENPHTVVSFLHLDFDIFHPTKVAL
ncbi:MAG TPA: TylF/MycF/NovP-related O-methyltransferase, partial [Nitrospira sp.]|nr:TylF/MycF/NovP-related O-methyltransferase [Nitrospira sp.]